MYVTGIDRYQADLMSMEDRIDKDNPVRVIDAFVDVLILNDLGFREEVPEYDPEKPCAKHLRNLGGRPSFKTKDLLKLYLYGYYNRIRSSRMLERECYRNIELYWLIGAITPNYHTIADFRKDHPDALKRVFNAFRKFLLNNELIAGEVIAVDGTKVRAVNSKKRNYNADKVNRHLKYIENKTEEYMKQLDEMDAKETATDDYRIKKEEVQAKIEKLKTNRAFYNNMAAQVAASDDGQVSTTDPDSRSLLIRHNQVEVGYNIQCATDSKNSLIVHFDVTNENDTKALYAVAQSAKYAVEKTDEDTIIVPADTGYHNGGELVKCEINNIITLVPPKDYSQRGAIPTADFLFEKFTYNEEADTYTCPQGETLITTGTWYMKDHGLYHGKKSTQYKVKHYKTTACTTCVMKQYCTKSTRPRLIERSEYQDTVERNNARVKANRELYSKRQQIVEHPFGTIKRAWGYYYTLLKGKDKINGEYALVFTVYNLRRSVSILGVNELIKRLKEFKNTLFKLFFNLTLHKRYWNENFLLVTGYRIGGNTIL